MKLVKSFIISAIIALASSGQVFTGTNFPNRPTRGFTAAEQQRQLLQRQQAAPKRQQAERQRQQNQLQQTAPERQYRAPELQYAAPQLQYAAPQLQYAAPQLQQAMIELQPSAPEQQYGVPELQFAAPQMQHAGPQQLQQVTPQQFQPIPESGFQPIIPQQPVIQQAMPQHLQVSQPRPQLQLRPELQQQQARTEQSARILSYINENDGRNYRYAYETENGIRAQEAGQTIKGTQAQGEYSYTGNDGQTYTVRYTADENGFRPQGDHLPTPPPIPEAIAKAIEQNAQDAANGIFDDGNYL
ncbi:uncharacterized protein LOC106137752 [Amyelois transitella]|uniref:uncharacterized protein LOC106137752 n=1 Tax=Amyelois transitella TaxID=680683 RepID=UPI0029904988|nr:uncharacterized protein LOC106137752 [Amyelois transitella]